MEINFNLGSLKIVHAPLMEYFKRIQKNVSSNLILMRDEKKIATNYEAIDLLSKTQSSLKMIGLTGLVKVLQLCNESLRNVRDVKFDTQKNIKILEACEKIFNNVELYIEVLLHGEFNQPTKFFTEYSALAELIGKKVTIKELFSPKLDVKEEMDLNLQSDLRLGIKIDNANKSLIISDIKTAQSIIDLNINSALEILKSEDSFPTIEIKNEYHEYCKKIYQAITEIQNLKISKNTYVLLGLQKLFVCVTSPIFNDEFKKTNDLGKDIVDNNFKNIQKTINELIVKLEELDDERSGSFKIDEEISKEVLYFLIQVLKDNKKLQEMPVYKETSAYFDFNFYNNQLKNTPLISTVFQKNPEIANQIDKIFLDVKEELTLITSKQSNADEFLVQHIAKFINFNQKLNDLLVANDIKELSGILNALSAIFEKIKNKEMNFTELLQKEVSLSVVLVEYGINTFLKSIVKEEDRSSFSAQVNLQQRRLIMAAKGQSEDLFKLALPILDEKSKKNDEKKALLKIYQELSKEFIKAENILDQFLKNQEDGVEEIKDVFKSLKSTRGIFSILGKVELSNIVNDIIKVWEKIVEKGINSIDKELLDNSIIWLSAISLIVSASKEDNETEANEIIANLLPKYNNFVKNNLINPVETSNKKNETIEIKLSQDIIKEVVKEVPIIVDNIATYKDTANDDELLNIYIIEVAEVLENMKDSLNKLKDSPNSTAELTNVRRFFHTLKGSGKMVGLKYLGEAAWIVEQTLNKVLAQEIEFTNELLEELNKTRQVFDIWIKKLEENKEVNVNLIEFKEIFSKYNAGLITTFPIGEENNKSEEKIEIKPVLIEIKSEVLSEPEVLLVGDKEITIILYNLFVEESTTHMRAMSSFVHNKNNKKGAALTEDFVLHAHTLASIAKTVNLLDCAKIASKIEFIANLALEKNISLKDHEMDILCHAVDSLEQFRSVANGVQIDIEQVNNLIEELSDLQESINDRNIIVETQETIVHENSATADNVEIQEEILVEEVRQEFSEKELTANDMESLANLLMKKLEPILNKKNDAIDMKELSNNITKDLDNKLNEKIIKLEESFNEQLNNANLKYNEDIKEELGNFIESNKLEMKSNLEENLNEIIENIFKENSSKIALQVKRSLDDSLGQIKDLLINLSEEVNSVKKINGESESNIVFNENEIVDNIFSQLSVVIEKQYVDISKVLAENKYNTKEVVNEMYNKIDKIEVSLNNILEKNKEIVSPNVQNNNKQNKKPPVGFLEKIFGIKK